MKTLEGMYDGKGLKIALWHPVSTNSSPPSW